MFRILLPVLACVFAALGILYQLYVRPLVVMGGRGFEVNAVGNQQCERDETLQACEKLVLHQSTGLIYLACSTPYFRTLWLPNAGHLNKTGAGHDYLAVYNPKTSTSTRLPLVRFTNPTGLSVLGMDVVSSSENPANIWAYVINNRAPPGNAWAFGPDSVVEIFHGETGGKNLKYVTTVDAPLIGMPNDIIGAPDGKSFYITNAKKTEGTVKRGMDILFQRPSTTVTFCHLDIGCKIAATGLLSSNGIARGKEGQIYVSSTFSSQIAVFDRQTDDSLVLADIIPIGGGGLDNLSVDADGALYAAEFPRVFHFAFRHLIDPNISSPSRVRKITLNTGESSFFGQKYNAETIFEDDGKIASGVTSAVFDLARKRLYMHGIAAPAFVTCTL